MRPKNPYSNAHARIRRLYNERIGDRMTQGAFAKRYKIGSGAMLTMLLNGKKPLSIEAAGKLAEGLDCNISDICPEMDTYLRDNIVPRLGKALRRAAMVLLTIGLFQFAPSDAYARAVLHNAAEPMPFFAKCLNSLHIVALWASGLLRRACGFLSVCVPAHQNAGNTTA